MQITEEIKHLFSIVRTKLGAPVRPIQLDDDQMCNLLEVAIGDYSEKVQNWVIESQWMGMYGKNFLNSQDLAYAFTVRTLDFSADYSDYFSKNVGLQQNGSFELKKDFITVEKGKQCYIVPAGRQINKVMYVTPSTSKSALYGNVGTLDTGLGGGYGQYGSMGNGWGLTGFYVGSAYDTALLATDLKYKNSLIRGDLTYKVTAGPNGTHIIHLMSVPGSPNMMGGIAMDDSAGWGKYVDCYVWYTYYDTGDNSEDADKCLLENKDTVLITPDRVPMASMRFELMNDPTKQIVRQLLVAESMITLGLIRGTYSGKVQIPDAEMALDYSMFKDLGVQEKEKAMTALKERLEAMLPWNMMKNMADLTDNLNKVLGQTPLGIFVI